MNYIPLVVFVTLTSTANALQCYNCWDLQVTQKSKHLPNGLTMPAKSCSNPLSSTFDTIYCGIGEQCLKIDMDLPLKDKALRNTVRMCGLKAYCDSIANCHACNSDFCNAATSQYLSITVVIATLAAYFSVFY